MKQFYLVRHSEFENPQNIFQGRLSFPLTEKGKENIRAAAELLKKKKIKKIFSSAVYRCRETAEIVSKIIKAPVLFDKRLLEHMTPIQGMALDEYRKDRNIRYTIVSEFGGETMMDVQVRMLDFFYEKVREEDDNILICSHGDPLYFLYLGIMKKNLPTDVYTIDRTQYPQWGSLRRIDIDGTQYNFSEFLN